MIDFGSRIQLAMIATGNDVPALAKKVPVSEAMVRRWLKLKSCRVSGMHLLRLSEILQVRIRWLVLGGSQLQRRLGLQYDEDELLNCYRILDRDKQRCLIDIAAVLSRDTLPLERVGE